MRLSAAVRTAVWLALVASSCGGLVVVDADPCDAFRDSVACASRPQCRWLVPPPTGCAGAHDRPLPEAGCHASADCGSDADCRGGTRCQDVVVDPCWYEGCQLCATGARVCAAP